MHLGNVPYHLIICILLIISFLLAKFAKIPFINKFNKNDNFSFLTITFKGIRTSIAFLEILSMSSIATINMSTFSAAVNLTKYEGSKIVKSNVKTEPRFFELFEDSDLTVVLNNYYCNFCLLGLITGFFLVTVFAYIKV